MKKNSVSIVIPAYNSEKVINKCLDSILNQTYKNFEIIVVNDGSKDNTLKILKEYDKKYDNITVLSKENGGQAQARNDGMKIAKGDFLMLVDSDDFLEEDYLEIMVNKAIETNADLCISGYKNFDDNYKFVSEVKYKDCFWTRFMTCVPWGKLFRMNFLREHDLWFPKLKEGEDNAFSIVTMSHTDKVTVVDNSGYGYYYNPTGLSKFTFKGFNLDILPANQYIFDNVNPEFSENNEKLMWYFYLKQSIYFILWSGKCETKKRFVAKNKELFKWLDENIKYYKKHKIAPFWYPKGERFSTRAIVFIYTILNRLGMVGLFASIFCTGKKNN